MRPRRYVRDVNRIELVDLGDGTWTWIVHREGELIFASASDCADAQAAEAAGRAYFTTHYPNASYTVVTRPTIDEATIQRLTDEAIAAASTLTGRASLLIVFARSTQTWELRVGTLANITTRLGDEQAGPIDGATPSTPPMVMRALVEKTTTQILEELYLHPFV
jgi:hypothetical protein